MQTGSCQHDAFKSSSLKSGLWFVFVVLFTAYWCGGREANADFLVVTRRVSLKGHPSAASPPLDRVEPGQQLALASVAQVNGYYEVRLPQGTSRWVYRSFVSRQAGTMAAEPAADAALGKLQIHVLNIGQGDAIFIRCPDGHHQMLIDSADTRYSGASATFKNRLTELQPKDDPIEVAIGSHPHSDHIGNMAWVMREYRVAMYVDDGVPATTATYRKLEQALTERHVTRAHVSDGVPAIDFCPLTSLSAVVLRPNGFGASSDPNDNSVIVRIDYGEDSFLFVGDCEKEEEEQLLGDPATLSRLDCDFLKVGHHGSDTSSTEEFLDAVSPDIAAMSPGAPGVSTNKGYMHPRKSTIDRLLRFVRAVPGPTRRLKVYNAATKKWTSVSVNGELYSTSLDGDLLFESDGHGIVYQSAQ